MTIQQREKILQLLYEKPARDSLHTLNKEDLVAQMSVTWDDLRVEVAYLEEKGYVGVKRSYLGTRVFDGFYITPIGVDWVDGHIITSFGTPSMMLESISQSPFFGQERRGDREQSLVKQKVCILCLTANPKDTTPLRLDEEVREIDFALRQAEFRDQFDIQQHRAVRVTDLQGYLLRHQPTIVHFSGHGSVTSHILLEDNQGRSHPVSARALSQVFSLLKGNIRCVVLNACYSEHQAQAIAQHVDCVVGMSQAIGDEAAISFARAFYQALGYGKDIKTAFDLGCAQIDLENWNEQDTPQLLAIRSDPSKIRFIKQR